MNTNEQIKDAVKMIIAAVVLFGSIAICNWFAKINGVPNDF